jgi:hypothetical protein
MAQKKTSDSRPEKVQTRDDRLKAALKANLARRKAQSRGRAMSADAGGNPSEGSGQDKD